AQHGPANEEVPRLRHLDFPALAFVAVDAEDILVALAVLSVSGTGFTTRPGATFCTPSTTTRSPALSPSSMIQRLPLHGPGFTSRAVTVSPAPTTYTYCLPSP